MAKKIKVPPDFEIPKDYRVIEYPFHLGDLAGGTAHLTNSQYGAYIRIILIMVNKPNGIHFDKLKAYSRMGKHWLGFWNLIEDKFCIKDNMVIHDRVRESVRKMAYVSHQNSNNALKNNKTAKANDKRKVSIPSTNLETIKPLKNIYKKEFDDFFKAYPKQSNMVDAAIEFVKHIENGVDPEEIIEAARNYAQEKIDTEKQYILSPVKFLEKQMYLDPEYNKPISKPVDLSKEPKYIQELADILGDNIAVTWFKKTKIDGDSLIVSNAFKRDWIKNNYLKAIKKIGIKDIRIEKTQ